MNNIDNIRALVTNAQLSVIVDAIDKLLKDLEAARYVPNDGACVILNDSVRRIGFTFIPTVPVIQEAFIALGYNQFYPIERGDCALHIRRLTHGMLWVGKARTQRITLLKQVREFLVEEVYHGSTNSN